MPRKERSNEEIIHAVHQVEGGEKVAEVCRRIGVSEQTFYRRKKQFAGLGLSSCASSGRCATKTANSNRSSRTSRWIGTFSRRLSEKSCEASRTLHPGGVGADGLPSESTPGRGAHPSAQRDVAVPEHPRSPRRLTTAAARARGGSRTVWVPTVDGVVETRRVAGECETGVPAVRRRRSDSAHPATETSREPATSAATGADAPERAVVDGLRERASRRRPVVSDVDGA